MAGPSTVSECQVTYSGEGTISGQVLLKRRKRIGICVKHSEVMEFTNKNVLSAIPKMTRDESLSELYNLIFWMFQRKFIFE